MPAIPTRTWAPIGDQLYDRERATREGHLWTTRQEIELGILTLDWQEPVDGVIHGPMSPVLGIQSMIETLPLRGVLAFAIGGVTAWCDAEQAEGAYTLLGVRNRYADGVADIYVVDRGSDWMNVCSDFTPKETADHG